MYGILKDDAAEQAQPKFKVGDKVRVVKLGDAKGGSGHDADIGDEDTIIAVLVDSRGDYEGERWFYNPDEIELVAQPKFKVGQRVRVVDADGGGKLGDIATVLKVGTLSTGAIYTLDGLSDGAEMLFENRLATAFLPGDAVRVTKHSGYFAAGDIGFVERQADTAVFVKHGSYQRIGLPIDADSLELVEAAADAGGYIKAEKIAAGSISAHPDGMFTIVANKFVIAADRPCIVARVVSGTPRPSNIPYVHASVQAATAEAERLARNNPGKEFAVYQRVAGRVAEVSYSMKEVA